MRIALLPEGERPYLEKAIVRGGGVLANIEDARALVWTQARAPDALQQLLRQHAHIEWVQLPWAGVEPYVHVIDRKRMWTAGQGVYADDVAEHALALMLAMLRDLPRRARATQWGQKSGRSLVGARVCIIGGGAIALSLVRLLAPFQVQVDIVRRTLRPFAAPVASQATLADLPAVLGRADVVVVACALTPQTHHVLNAHSLARMQAHACVVNVARGQHIDTDALVEALQQHRIGGAALDVTEPEPLPPGHALWSLPNVLITPHTANTDDMAVPVLSARVEENVRRFVHGWPLFGVVDVDAGY
jgi:phosphoglycerate dehydrogenase-like enzyme